MKKLIMIVLLIVVFFTGAAYSLGSTGTIRGKVTINGKPAAGAEIVLIDENMDTLIQTTNSQGYYSFGNLKYGRYLITVKVDGKFYLKYKIKK